MSKSEHDFKNASGTQLRDLYDKAIQEKNELELNRIYSKQQILKSKQRTIDLFGKMIDLKKAQKIINKQNKELEAKNLEINRQKNAIEHTFQKFRRRTIELFGKMIDLKKANKIIQQQSDEIEAQRKQLLETNASKDKFFSILAHDLKNPIAGFLGLTELMTRRKVDLTPEDQHLFAESLHESSKQLYCLLENLLNWARSQTGSLQITPQELDLNDILTSTINQVNTNAQLKNITISKNNVGSIIIFADEDTMVTTLRNLLSNAIKFSNQNSFIDITVSQNETFALIAITDYGTGMTPQELEKLFKIEYSISQNGTAKEKGTSLGLILCKEFIQLNGGLISVNSIKGKGSTFSVTVPLMNTNIPVK